jgi:predicted chitinase
MSLSWLYQRVRRSFSSSGRRALSRRPRVEWLEDRWLPNVDFSLGGGYSIASYTNVGFQENELASFNVSVNGQPDPHPGDFQAQINWSGGSSSGDLVYNGSDSVRSYYTVKGTHVYDQSGSNIPINVTITGPEGSSTSGQTALASVKDMPTGIAGTQPPAGTGSAAPESVDFSLGGGYSIGSYTGVGFQENELASFNVSVNGKPDPHLNDFQAQINWGDDSSWHGGDLVYNGSDSVRSYYTIKGTHVYQNADSNIPIVVYVTGPDNTSTSGQTALANVTDMPSGIPGTQPSAATGSAAPESVDFSLGGGYSIGSYTGVGFQENELASFNVSVNGKPDPNLGDFQAQINWGDDSSWHGGDLVYNGSDSVRSYYTIKGTHVYQKADSNIPIVVYLTGPDNTSTSGQTALANVTDMPSGKPGTQPSATGTAAPESVGLSLGGGYSISSMAGVGFQNKELASFNVSVNGQPDSTTGDFTAQINWGDDSSWYDATVVYNGSDSVRSYYTIEGSHVYHKPGSNIPIVVYLAGPDGTSTSGQTALANVAPNPDPVPTLHGEATITDIAGDDLGTPLATFQDSGPTTGLKATLEATGFPPQTGTIVPDGGDVFSIETGSDDPISWPQPGSDTITVTLTGDNGDTSSVSDQVTVVLPPQISGRNVNGVEGQSLGPVAVASFTPSQGGSAPTAAVINWGDGSATTQGTLQPDGQGGYLVLGRHTYAEDGSYALSVSFTDPDGAVSAAQGTATVAEAALNGHGNVLHGEDGTPQDNVVVATFWNTGNESGEQYTAIIDWGDGSATEPGTLVPDGNGYDVVGSHTYETPGLHQGTVTVTEIETGAFARPRARGVFADAAPGQQGASDKLPFSDQTASSKLTLILTPRSTSQVDVTWTAQDGATSYTVYRAEGNLAPVLVKNWISIDTTQDPGTFPATGLKTNTVYSFKVVADVGLGKNNPFLQAQAKTISDSKTWGKLSGQQLSTIAHEASGNASLQTLNGYASALNKALAANKMTALAEQAAFLGQATQETIHLTTLTEGGNGYASETTRILELLRLYGPEYLNKVSYGFQKDVLPYSKVVTKEPADLVEHTRHGLTYYADPADPDSIVIAGSGGTKSYAGTAGKYYYYDPSGNYYYGRGFLQLTHDYNYKAASGDLYKDENKLFDDPSLVATDDQVAANTSLWFWANKHGHSKLTNSELADQLTVNDFKTITKNVHGNADSSEAVREKYYRHALEVLYFGLQVNESVAAIGKTRTTTLASLLAVMKQKQYQPGDLVTITVGQYATVAGKKEYHEFSRTVIVGH